jgi:hypothetical protein
MEELALLLLIANNHKISSPIDEKSLERFC